MPKLPSELMPTIGATVSITIERSDVNRYTVWHASSELDPNSKWEIGRIDVRDPRTFEWASGVQEDTGGGEPNFATALHRIITAWLNHRD